MCLARKQRRRGGAGGLGEARWGGREAHEGFGEVELAGIVPAGVLSLVSLGDIGGGYSQLGVDFVEWCLGRREAELTLEEQGLGRITIRVRYVEALGGID